ncbi:hypothetical protein GCM10029992_38050 [Glycomyces albus]
MTSHDTQRNVLWRFCFAFSLVAAGFAAACTSESGDAIETDSPSGSDRPNQNTTEAPEDIDDPEQAAIAAYLRYWDTVVAAFADPDGDFTEFEAVAADGALEHAISIEQRALDEGLHGTGTPTHEVTVKETLLTDEVQQVVVTDCSDSSDTAVLDAEDNPVPGEEYGAREIKRASNYSTDAGLSRSSQFRRLDHACPAHKTYRADCGGKCRLPAGLAAGRSGRCSRTRMLRYRQHLRGRSRDSRIGRRGERRLRHQRRRRKHRLGRCR